MFRFLWMAVFLLVVPAIVSAQSGFFVKRAISQVPEVYISDNSQLEMPFAGGLNNCQFGSIELNADGMKDLEVFDRHGYRI